MKSQFFISLRMPTVLFGTTRKIQGAASITVRLISVINRIFKACGLNDLEQIENAPEYDPGVVLNAEVIEAYLKGRVAAAR